MMNLRYIKIGLVLFVGALTSISCEEDLGFKEAMSDDSSVPRPVTNVAVTNLPGRAKLTYTMPDDPNLLYVKAVYTITNGKQIEVKTSYYSNEMEVEGFADTTEHEINLYTVSRKSIVSEPTTVMIKPLEAPIWKVYRSINVQNAFGGYNLVASNPDKQNISIMVMKPNVFNEFEVDNFKSVFTTADDILSKIRGLDTVSYEYKIFVRDKWGNATDTMTTTVRPIFEKEFDRTMFKNFTLPGDAPQVAGGHVGGIWDNRTNWGGICFTHQVNGGPDPHMITFDTGVLAKISRFWFRPYPELNPNQYYFLTSLKRFEIYGSANPNLSGALDSSWELLGTYEVKKPSGTPYGQDTALDREVASKGWDFDVRLDAPRVRYIRVRCLENWSGGTALIIAEGNIYGDPR